MRTWLFACVVWIASGCNGGGCGKTPVPFKRGPQPAEQTDKAPELPTQGTQYARLTRDIKIGESQLTRGDGAFRAALEWDLAADGSPDLLVLATDERPQAALETWTKPASEAPTRRAVLPLTPINAGCDVEQANLSRLGPDVVLAALDVVCVQEPQPPVGTPTPTDPLAEPPPSPGTQTHAQHQFVIDGAGPEPRLLLHLAVLPPSDPSDASTIKLTVASQDTDADQHSDVQVTAEVTTADATTSVPLLWLNRPSGLARDRAEPERTLTTLADPAFQNPDPVAALPAAQQVLETHRALCHESGAARLWVDESLGITCGPSAAAGRAAVVRALALAKQQQLLPALQARNRLSDTQYRVEAADRDRVNAAIATIRGQTSYVWERGPDLALPNAPNVHVPVLGFTSEDQLLLRPLGQTYDVVAHNVAPSPAGQGVIMLSPSGQFAAIDIVRDCAGQYLRLVPSSSIVSGYVASGRGQDVALVAERAGTEGCADHTRRTDHSGWTVLGLTQQGALLAKGADLQLIPLDAEGKSAGPARMLGPTEPAPPLAAAGGLSQTGFRHALATSEGVAVIDRGPRPGSSLIRSPASCTARIADVATSPSGQRFAMTCAGRVYWAHAAEPQPAQN